MIGYLVEVEWVLGFLALAVPVVGWLATRVFVMFQPEIKVWLVGIRPRRIEKMYRRAYDGDREARHWCRKHLPDEWRERLIDEARENQDPYELWKVMAACDPDMSVDA